MRQIDDAPDIREALRTGYPSGIQCVCPKCGEDIGNYIYTTDDGDMCGECFAEYMKDTCPQCLRSHALYVPRDIRRYHPVPA